MKAESAWRCVTETPPGAYNTSAATSDLSGTFGMACELSLIVSVELVAVVAQQERRNGVCSHFHPLDPTKIECAHNSRLIPFMCAGSPAQLRRHPKLHLVTKLPPPSRTTS